jgi:hypothetical protein
MTYRTNPATDPYPAPTLPSAIFVVAGRGYRRILRGPGPERISSAVHELLHEESSAPTAKVATQATRLAPEP